MNMQKEIDLLKNIKVLYVEDEPITRIQISKALKKKVGKLILAENGLDGIKKFLEFKPDLIITDLVMPDMPGIEMMKKIRSLGYKLPFIVTSALSDASTILQTVDLKIEKYMVKPIDLQLLLEVLKNLSLEVLSKNDNFILGNNTLLDNKTELEFIIRNIFSKYLKTYTGKGAKTIHIFISSKKIEILFKDSLTIIESSLLNCGNNEKLVELIRRSIYDSTIQNFKSELEENLIGKKIKLIEMNIHPLQNFERLVFEII